MNPTLPDINLFNLDLTALSAYLEHHGYRIFFLGIFFESFGLPAPGETLLIVGGILAAKGHFSIILIMALGFISAVLGDNVGYAIGLFAGRRFCVKYGRYIFLGERRLDKLEKFFEKYGSEVVIVARFIAGLRQFNGIIAGIGKMRWRKFLLYNIIGAALWVVCWSSIAYIAGNRAEGMFSAFTWFEYLFLAGLLLFLALFVVYKFTKKKHGTR